jgi:hypothetical protein
MLRWVGAVFFVLSLVPSALRASAVISICASGCSTTTITLADGMAASGDILEIQDSRTYAETWYPQGSRTLRVSAGSAPVIAPNSICIKWSGVSGTQQVIDGSNGSLTLRTGASGVALQHSAGVPSAIFKHVTFIGENDFNSMVGSSSAGAKDLTFDSCIFNGSDLSGIKGLDFTTSGPAQLHLRNCLFKGFGSAGGIGIGLSGSQTGSIGDVVHCTFADCVVGISADERFNITHSLFGTCATDISGSGTFSKADIVNSMLSDDYTTGWGGGTVTGVGPGFVNPSTGDYHLASNSPAVDGLTFSAGVSVDLEGNSRPLGAGYDYGCYERNAALTPTPTQTPWIIPICSACTYTTIAGAQGAAGSGSILEIQSSGTYGEQWLPISGIETLRVAAGVSAVVGYTGGGNAANQGAVVVDTTASQVTIDGSLGSLRLVTGASGRIVTQFNGDTHLTLRALTLTASSGTALILSSSTGQGKSLLMDRVLVNGNAVAAVNPLVWTVSANNQVQIYNSLFYNLGTGVALNFSGDAGGITGSLVNDTFVKASVALSTASRFRILNCLFYNNTADFSLSGSFLKTDATYNAFGTENASTWPASDQGPVTPAFVAPASSDYRLQASGTGVDQGTDASAYLSTDYFGTSRPQGAGWDMGFHESIPIPSPTPTITPTPTACSLANDGFSGASLGSAWSSGAVGTATGSTAVSGSLSITVRSGDITGSSDNFYYVYQSGSGDFDVSVKVNSLGTATLDCGGWSKTGLMLRQNLTSGSSMAMMSVSRLNGFELLARDGAGQVCQTDNKSGASAAPAWLRLVKAGNSITGYYSLDGSTWIQEGGKATVTLSGSFYIGIAASTCANAAGGTGQGITGLSNFNYLAGGVCTTFSPSPTPTCGVSSDSFGAASMSSFWSSTYTAGATLMGATQNGSLSITVQSGDIGGSADSLNYLYQTMSGDIDVRLRINSLSAPTADCVGEAKGGLMIRQDTSAGSLMAFIGATRLNGYRFRARATASAAPSVDVSAPASFPAWVRLQKAGNALSAYYSSDGSTWTALTPAATVGFSGTFMVGIATASCGSNGATEGRYNDFTVLAGGNCIAFSPTASPSPTSTGTPTITPSVTPSATPTWTPTATPSITPSPSSTWTPTDTPTATPTASPTWTPTVTPTQTPSASPTWTPTDSPTATPSASPTWTPTDSPTATPSASPTWTPTDTPTATPSASPTSSPTATPTATPSASPTWTPTDTPTMTPSASPTWTPTITPSSTPSASPTWTTTATPSNTPSDSPTGTPTTTPSGSPTWTPTATPSASPSGTPSITTTASPSATPSATRTASPSVTPTATPSITLTASPTRTPSMSPSVTPTATPSATASGTPSITLTATPSGSPTLTRTGTPSRTLTPSPSSSPTATPTWTPCICSPTDTFTPAPPGLPLTLRVYDSSGLMVAQVDLGPAPAVPSTVSLSADPWDPSQGPLILSNGAWSAQYNGVDSSGAVLRNGVYLLDLSGPSGASVHTSMKVLGTGGGRVSLIAGPNPLRPGAAAILINFSPITLVELKIYGLDGGLIRDLGVVAPPVTWDLRTQQGDAVANGLFIVSARLPGERQPQTFKLMVAR